MAYVIKNKDGRYLNIKSIILWEDHLEWADVWRDCDKEEAEDWARDYQLEDKEVYVQHIRMEEIKNGQ